MGLPPQASASGEYAFKLPWRYLLESDCVAHPEKRFAIADLYPLSFSWPTQRAVVVSRCTGLRFVLPRLAQYQFNSSGEKEGLGRTRIKNLNSECTSHPNAFPNCATMRYVSLFYWRAPRFLTYIERLANGSLQALTLCFITFCANRLQCNHKLFIQ